MSIRTLLVALNPSRKVLLWITATAIAAIPTVWLISAKQSTEKVMNDTRLTKLEVSVETIDTKIDKLTLKFDDAEQRFTDTYQTGVDEVGEIIKESDKQQTAQIKFLVDNWSESNRLLISEALELRQTTNESKIDEMIEEAKKQPYRESDVEFQPVDEQGRRIYLLYDADMILLDSISRNYKILSVQTNSKSKYDIEYREYSTREKEDIDYFNK